MSPKTASGADVPSINLDDILDYAFCSLRVWWRRFSPEAERADTLSGEDLMRAAVKETIRQKYLKPGAPPAEILGRIWHSWLTTWGIPALHKDLSEFASAYRKLMEDFSDRGSFRRKDNTAYVKPTWSNAWRDQFSARGLNVLRRTIGQQQHLAGLPEFNEKRDEGGSNAPPPLGLAEAYALSLAMVSRFDQLPATVLGVHIQMVVDLPSIQLKVVSDLVNPIGKARGRGRPTATETHEQEVVQYELHLYEEARPTSAALFHDFRVQALSHARPVDIPSEKIRTESILVRHMRSGKYEILKPRSEGGLLSLETAARMAYQGIRAGIFLPRSAFDISLCMDCPLRPRCFVGDGVLERLTFSMPPNLDPTGQFAKFLHKTFDSRRNKKDQLEAAAEVLRWMSRFPAATPEQLQWIIQSYLGS